MSLTYAFAIIIAYFLYSHLFMLQQAVGAGFRESLLLSQSSSAVFSDVTVIVSPARFGVEQRDVQNAPAPGTLAAVRPVISGMSAG